MNEETEHLLKNNVTTSPTLNSKVQMMPVNLASHRDTDLLVELLINVIENEVVLHDVKFMSEKSIWIAFQPRHNTSPRQSEEEIRQPRETRKMHTRLIQLKLQVAKYLWKAVH
jgi:hypothetical protein